MHQFNDTPSTKPLRENHNLFFLHVRVSNRVAKPYLIASVICLTALEVAQIIQRRYCGRLMNNKFKSQ